MNQYQYITDRAITMLHQQVNDATVIDYVSAHMLDLYANRMAASKVRDIKLAIVAKACAEFRASAIQINTVIGRSVINVSAFDSLLIATAPDLFVDAHVAVIDLDDAAL